MMLKTSDLTGTALHWAVAQLECEDERSRVRIKGSEVFMLLDGGNPFGPARSCGYSTDWSKGGPIIEREDISIYKMGHQWLAGKGTGRGAVFGPTPLIAAMRCYVASKFGDEVEVPDQLLETT